MKQQQKKLSLFEVLAMAVGTMIGASIFSIFGLGAKVAGNTLPLAFLLSGSYAMIVAYSYAKLGSKIASNSGPIGFILRGLGDNVITGALSFLFWLSYVVSISLLVKGFSGYFIPLFNLPKTLLSSALIEASIITLFVALNFIGSKAVGKTEKYIVIVKLLILLLFIAVGMISVDVKALKPDIDGSHISGLINASVILFLSFMGFGLITNASENLKNPRKNVPKAIYLSIFVVLAFYILISVVTIGNLSMDEIVEAKENAIAKAAEPFLGKAGFLLISIAALFSVSSSINASIYGGANIAWSLAKIGKLPGFFERKVWFNSTEGLFITAGLGLVFALLFNLGDMATITSSIFTIIYIFVVISHIRLRKKYGGNLVLLIFNLTTLSAVFVALLLYEWNSHRSAFWGTLITLGGALLLESIFRWIKSRLFEQKQEVN